MKVELKRTMRGDLKLEIIAETDVEYHLLDSAWELQGYERGNGKTVTPNKMQCGFYIPLCTLVKEWRPEPPEAIEEAREG